MLARVLPLRMTYAGALLVALSLLLPYRAVAHDIPNDVMVQAFVRPAGERLHLVVRVPLNAMRDVTFPERGPGYLDLARADLLLSDAANLWIADFTELYEGDTRSPRAKTVASRVSLPSDKSFVSYEEALAHITGPKLPNDTNVPWEQLLLDVLFEYPIQSDRSRFSIHPAFARLGVRVVTVLRFLPPGGAIRPFEFQGDPGLVRLDPQWHQAALRFVASGFFHILDGTDHLLFLLCLVIPFRRFRGLIPIVTSFTVAHSITLIASAYNFGPGSLWFPALIETLIVISILYMALENIVGASSVPRRWMIAFGFGLVHGFGFSFALRETLQFAGSHLLTSLLSFNVGVELGQILIVAMFVPVLELLFRFVVAERMGTIILCALVAHTAWHWTIERAEQLYQYQFQWPAFNPTLLASAMRSLMLILIVVGLVWLVIGVLHYRMKRNHESKASPAP